MKRKLFARSMKLLGSFIFLVGLLILLAPLGVARASSLWTPTGSMAITRTSYTSTLLQNGKVLVAGGSDPSGIALASAELYDPATGTWSLTGSMANGRIASSATRLANGKVLMISGWTGSPALLSSSELYDPSTGTWSFTGNVITPRLYHSSVLLHNGKVLVAGGNTYGTPTASAELYDPTTGTWTPTASMSVPRSGPTAALLANGKVLVYGGSNGSGDLASAELYGDITPPAITITAPVINATYLYQQVVNADYTCTDSESGVATCNGTVPNGSPIDTSSVGWKNFSVTATDNAANTATSAVQYGVNYGWSGFLQPINADGSSIFKLGRTVPVKFQLTGVSAGISNAVAKLYIAKIDNGIEGTDLEAISTAAADSGNTFRYDSTSQQYIFNLGTKGLTTGTYRLKVYVGGDNTTGVLQGEVIISLK